MRRTITLKAGGLLLLPALWATVCLSIFLYFLRTLEDEASLLSAATEFRTHSRLIHETADSANVLESNRGYLKQVVPLLDQIAKALERGGKAGPYTVPQAPQELTTYVQAVQQRWGRVQALLQLVVDRPLSDPVAAAAFRQLHPAVPQLQSHAGKFHAAVEEHMRSQRRRMLNTVVAACVFAAGLLIFGLWAARRFLVQPVRLLEEGTRRVVAGDFTHRVPVRGEDEFAALAASFNAMTERLGETQAQVRAHTSALQESEARFRLLSETLPQFVWTCRPDGYCDYLNARWVEYTGIPEADQLGYAWLERLHPDDREPTMEAWQKAVDHDVPFDVEFRILGKGGEYRWFKTRAIALRDENRHIVKWFGTNTDIDDLKRAEQSLRESEDRFRRLVEADVAGIVITDAERILEANNHFLNMLGYSRQDLQAGAIDWRDVTVPEYGEISARAVRQLLETGTCAALEKEYLRKDGGRIPVLVGSVALQRGAHPQFLSFVIDLTERKRLEDQFRQAQKMESIGHLAGGVAHDFNNLLTVISGYARMIQDQLTTQDRLFEPIEEICKAATRAAGLTRQLLIFSRSQPHQPKNIVLNDVVQHLQKMLRRLIGEDVELVLSLGAETGVIRADPSHIEQVIVNLAVNARDAMPGGGKLLIETASLFVDEQFAHMHLSVSPGAYMMLAVSDTGTGMSPEVQTHIFEPFFTTKEQGTGLGLATVYGIVKQSGGSIWVYSEPGQGSTFKMLFPTIAAAGEPGKTTPVETIPSGTETILLAEDEAGVRKYVRQVLERYGYNVLEASNGREAIELARQHAGPIDFLLTDMVMPEMGGPDLANQFTSLRPGIPVLCMSGYTDRVWGDGEKMAVYIQKPFTPTALLTQIRALLDAA